MRRRNRPLPKNYRTNADLEEKKTKDREPIICRGCHTFELARFTGDAVSRRVYQLPEGWEGMTYAVSKDNNVLSGLCARCVKNCSVVERYRMQWQEIEQRRHLQLKERAQAHV